MSFDTDQRVADEAGRWFGEYIVTYKSDHGQVRADLFRKGGGVVAHVSFPTGLDAGRVTDPYFSALWDYAREHDLRDQFKLVYS